MALSQPDVIADEELSRRLFRGHPYASGLPSPGALRQVSAAHLRRIHDEILAPRLGHFVLVGRRDSEEGSSPLRQAALRAVARAERRASLLRRSIRVPAVRLGPLQLFDRPGRGPEQHPHGAARSEPR